MEKITVAEDNEFSIIIADFIETLANTEKFVLKIWINSEIPYEFDETCDFYFMQEGFRVLSMKRIDWFFYDNIVSMRLYHES